MQPSRPGPFQLRLKSGKQAYCVIEVRRGEEEAVLMRSGDQLNEDGGEGGIRTRVRLIT